MNRYMEEADRLAAENLRTNNGGPFGAVVVRDGEITLENKPAETEKTETEEIPVKEPETNKEED